SATAKHAPEMRACDADQLTLSPGRCAHLLRLLQGAVPDRRWSRRGVARLDWPLLLLGILRRRRRRSRVPTEKSWLSMRYCAHCGARLGLLRRACAGKEFCAQECLDAYREAADQVLAARARQWRNYLYGQRP